MPYRQIATTRAFGKGAGHKLVGRFSDGRLWVATHETTTSGNVLISVSDDRGNTWDDTLTDFGDLTEDDTVAAVSDENDRLFVAHVDPVANNIKIRSGTVGTLGVSNTITWDSVYTVPTIVPKEGGHKAELDIAVANVGTSDYVGLAAGKSSGGASYGIFQRTSGDSWSVNKTITDMAVNGDWVAVDFRHTGDGKTAASSPDFFFAAKNGAADLNIITCTYASGPTWTESTNVTYPADVIEPVGGFSEHGMMMRWTGYRLLVAVALTGQQDTTSGSQAAAFVKVWRMKSNQTDLYPYAEITHLIDADDPYNWLLAVNAGGEPVVFFQESNYVVDPAWNSPYDVGDATSTGDSTGAYYLGTRSSGGGWIGPRPFRTNASTGVGSTDGHIVWGSGYARADINGVRQVFDLVTFDPDFDIWYTPVIVGAIDSDLYSWVAASDERRTAEGYDISGDAASGTPMLMSDGRVVIGAYDGSSDDLSITVYNPADNDATTTATDFGVTLDASDGVAVFVDANDIVWALVSDLGNDPWLYRGTVSAGGSVTFDSGFEITTGTSFQLDDTAADNPDLVAWNDGTDDYIVYCGNDSGAGAFWGVVKRTSGGTYSNHQAPDSTDLTSQAHAVRLLLRHTGDGVTSTTPDVFVVGVDEATNNLWFCKLDYTFPASVPTWTAGSVTTINAGGAGGNSAWHMDACYDNDNDRIVMAFLLSAGVTAWDTGAYQRDGDDTTTTTLHTQIPGNFNSVTMDDVNFSCVYFGGTSGVVAIVAEGLQGGTESDIGPVWMLNDGADTTDWEVAQVPYGYLDRDGQYRSRAMRYPSTDPGVTSWAVSDLTSTTTSELVAYHPIIFSTVAPVDPDAGKATIKVYDSGAWVDMGDATVVYTT